VGDDDHRRIRVEEANHRRLARDDLDSCVRHCSRTPIWLSPNLCRTSSKFRRHRTDSICLTTTPLPSLFHHMPAPYSGQAKPPHELTHGFVSFRNSWPSIRALLSAVAGSLKPELLSVPRGTLTPPLPTFTVRASADWRSALAPPTGWSGSGRFAFTRSICSALDSCSDSICC
jgi:hypothetical protein